MAKKSKAKPKPVDDEDVIDIDDVVEEEPAPKSKPKTKAKSKANKASDEDEPVEIDEEPAPKSKPKTKAKAEPVAEDEDIEIDDLIEEPAPKSRPKTKAKAEPVVEDEDIEIDDLIEEEPAPKSKPKTKAKAEPVAEDEDIEIDDLIEEEPAPKSKPKTKAKAEPVVEDEDIEIDDLIEEEPAEDAGDIEDISEEEPAEEPKPKTKVKAKTRMASAEDEAGETADAADEEPTEEDDVDIDALLDDEPADEEMATEEESVEEPKSKTKVKAKTRMADEDDAVESDDTVEEDPEFKPKTKVKAKTRMADEDDAVDIEDTEDAEEDEPKPKTKVKAKTRMASTADEDEDEIEELPDEEPEEQTKGKTKVKAKTRMASDEDDAETTDLDVGEGAEESDDDTEQMKGDAGIVSGDDIDALKTAPEEDAEEEPAAIDQPPPAPTPKVSMLTLFLIILNWGIVPIFLFLAFADHAARSQNSYAAIVNHVAIWGLPLEQEEETASVSEHTRPVYRLSPDQLKSAYQSRRGSMTDAFVPVEEPVPLRLPPSSVTYELKADLFGADDKLHVGTLEEEIRRLKALLPEEIKRRAAEVVKQQKSDKEKRELAGQTLLVLAWNVHDVRDLKHRIDLAKGAELDNLVEDGVQRRLYYDILAPYSVFRPGDIKDTGFKVDKIVDKNSPRIEELKAILEAQFDAVIAPEYKRDANLGKRLEDNKVTVDGAIHSLKRDSIEKRQTIAFTLFTLSQVIVPERLVKDEKFKPKNERLFPKGVERASLVCGFYEFTNASIHFVTALTDLEIRRENAIKADREGYVVAKGPTLTQGYVDRHDIEVDRIVKLAAQIDIAKAHLDDAKKLKKFAEETYLKRAQQHKDALTKLLKARKNTHEAAEELRLKQNQLHEALIELSDAGERNFRLEAEIRAIELRLLGPEPKKKGARP